MAEDNVLQDSICRLKLHVSVQYCINLQRGYRILIWGLHSVNRTIETLNLETCAHTDLYVIIYCNLAISPVYCKLKCIQGVAIFPCKYKKFFLV